jgi:hypothetical protein
VTSDRSGATSSRVLDVPATAVAMVLADPRLYDGVVVGSRRIRWFDPRWPEEGTRFDHTIGVGPLTIRDHSDVVESDLPRLLRLAVHLRPLGSAEVTFRVTPEPSGTRVDIVEVPTSGLLAATWSRPAAALTRWRNDRVLHRLEKLAGDRARTAGLG